MCAVLAFNLPALTARWTLGEDLARAGWKRTRRVLLLHAGRLVERDSQFILKLRNAGTEELRAALQSLDERSTALGQRWPSQPLLRSAGNSGCANGKVPVAAGLPGLQPWRRP